VVCPLRRNPRQHPPPVTEFWKRREITISSCSRLTGFEEFSEGDGGFLHRTMRLLQLSHLQFPFGMSWNSPPTMEFISVD